MKKKICYLLILVFLTSGCSVEYNLYIDNNNNYKEDFTVTAVQTEEYDLDYLISSYEEEYPIFNDQEFQYYDPYQKNDKYTYYDKSYVRIENGYIFNYKANFEYSNFNRARTLKTVFKTGGVGYIKEDDYYYISVSNPIIFNYNNDIDSIKINISFKDSVVISNNASSVSGNTYSWVLTKNSNNSINIKYKLKSEDSTKPSLVSPEKTEESSNKNEKTNPLEYILVGAIVLLFMIVLVGFIKYKSVRK